MSVYYINPTIKIIPNKFENIMDNLINEISNLFVDNNNLIIQSNYTKSIFDIVKVLINYLKIYKFYDYDIKNIYVQIYNKSIDVLININVNISKTYFMYTTSTWNEFYFGIVDLIPIVYNALSNNQQMELNVSILNGEFYFYNNINLIELNYKKGIILKKKYCSCIINNCNANFNYIITLFW